MHPAMNHTKQLEVFPLRRMEYKEALAEQMRLFARCAGSGGCENFLLPVEHPPVITQGRTAEEKDIRTPTASLLRQGVDVVETGRGGKTTFHGPGQLVMYPIIDLRQRGRDLHRYLREIEDWIIALLAAFSVEAHTRPPYTGVWINGAKIASIGIAVRRWITYHGVALNVSTDMRFFNHIVPCGLKDVTMTSLESLTGRRIPLENAAETAAGLFRSRFGFPCDG